MDESTEIIKNIFNQNRKSIIIFLLVVLLLIGNIVLSVFYYTESKECNLAKTALKNQQTNAKVVAFTKLFIEQVLRAQGEVSFEQRLRLENSVRDLQDPEILVQWEKFTSSKTEADAQAEVKNLLSLLVNKIVY